MRVNCPAVASTTAVSPKMSVYNECGITNSTLETINLLHFLSYVVLNQIYLIVGFLGNLILLIAFYRQSKTEKAYGYQIYLTISKIFEVLSFSIFLTTLKRFSGAENNEADWFVSNYPIMYLTARLGPVAHMVFIVTSLLLTLAMTVDRLLALTIPFVYKNLNLPLHQAMATGICFTVGVLSSVSDAWRYDVGGVKGHYKLITDKAYVETTAAIVSAHIRTAVRFIGVFSLILLNIVVAVLFIRRSRKVGQITTANDQKQKARRSAEKNLLLLNIYQSILMSINQIPHMGYHVLAYLVSSFTECAGMVYSPTADAMVMLTDSIDLFILMGVNKKMRNSVRRGLACLPCCKSMAGGDTTVVVSEMVSVRINPQK